MTTHDEREAEEGRAPGRAAARGLSRRELLGALGATGAALLAGAAAGGCGDSSSEASAHANRGGDGPEVRNLRIGIIALTDCSSIVIAKEKGFFARHGLDVTVVKGASWAAIRDSLSHGDLHATHMLLGMPIASTIGLGGSPRVPMVVPWMINRNGQAITLKAAWKGKVAADPTALAPLAAEANPKTVKAALKALHEASVWLDTMTNRAEQARIVSRTTYINCPPAIIQGRLEGRYDYGDGRTKDDPHYMIFHDRNCNYPQPKYAVWWLSQFRRWGMVEGAPDYAGIAAEVMRPDLYEAAMQELGAEHGGRSDAPETLFDGVTFDPARPEAYALGFAVKSPKG